MFLMETMHGLNLFSCLFAIQFLSFFGCGACNWFDQLFVLPRDFTFAFTSNLVIETSQQISDVPFGDCFCVEVQAVSEPLLIWWINVLNLFLFIYLVGRALSFLRNRLYDGILYWMLINHHEVRNWCPYIAGATFVVWFFSWITWSYWTISGA
jgi:hypothetical protein